MLREANEKLEPNRKEALTALEEVDTDSDSGKELSESIEGVATLKDVIANYLEVQSFSASFAPSSTRNLSSWFDNAAITFFHLSLVGASNSQFDGTYGSSNFLVGSTVQQLLDSWGLCSAWSVAGKCRTKIKSAAKVSCDRAGHSAQHVSMHHANLATLPFDRPVRFSQVLLEKTLTDNHMLILLFLGLRPVRQSLELPPAVWQRRSAVAVQILGDAEGRRLQIVFQVALFFVRTQSGMIHINARVPRPGLPAAKQHSMRAAAHPTLLLLEWLRRIEPDQPSPTQHDVAPQCISTPLHLAANSNAAVDDPVSEGLKSFLQAQAT